MFVTSKLITNKVNREPPTHKGGVMPLGALGEEGKPLLVGLLKA